MPELRTDDGPRKLRAVWLGPKGATLPFEWSYVTWGFFLLGLVAGAALGWVIASLLGSDMAVAWGVIYGAPGGGFLAYKAVSKVSFEEPLRYKRSRLLVQLGGSQRGSADRGSQVVHSWPRIGYLSESALQCMRWSDPEQRR